MDKRKNESKMKSAAVDIGAGRFELSEVGLIDAWLEVLEYANRPVFILDLKSHPVAPIHYNKTLRARSSLRLAVETRLTALSNQRIDDFYQWALADENQLEGYKFGGYSWISTIVGLRFKIISGIQYEEDKPYSQGVDLRAIDRRRQLSESLKSPSLGAMVAQESGKRDVSSDSEGQNFHEKLPPNPTSPRSWRQNSESFDWTDPGPVANLSEHENYLRRFEWSSTPLGPIQGWSTDLRKRCILLTSDCRPAALYYGDKKTIIYNEAYISLIGNRHPAMLGRSLAEAWGSLADRYSSSFERAAISGRATYMNNEMVNIARSGYIEEAHFNWTVIPIRSPEGGIGFYNPIHETTRQVIGERRMKSLLNLGQSLAPIKKLSCFWSSILEGLKFNVYEVPFCLLYSKITNSGKEGGNCWALEGAIGVQNERDTEYDNFGLFSTPNSSAKLDVAFASGNPTFLHTEDGTLPPMCVEKLRPRGHGDNQKSAVVLPITVGPRTLGFLLLGLNPRRPYDSDYEDFLYVLSRMLATTGASAVLFEEEIRLGQRVAERLSQEAKDSETRFRKLAESAPVGIFKMDSSLKIQYANDYWYSITESSKDMTNPVSWDDIIADEDIPRMEQQWPKLKPGYPPVTCELRLKKGWATNEMVGTTPVMGDTWILVAASPEFFPDGSVKGIVGCLTDISRQKWAEGFQKQRTQQAIELKSRQEKFIDMTSHELRNPMSAILHCADEISSSLSRFEAAAVGDAKITDLVAEMADAAATIIHCSEHQKRIIDDILTLSKLESDLLIIAPVDVQPLSVIRTAMKMFEGELFEGDVRMDLVVEQSFYDMKVDWVKLDPSRFLQIIINLAGNAVKFTRSEQKREIQIIVNASSEKPSNGTYGIDYLPPRGHRADKAEGPEWGTGRVFYLHVAIKDTGRGLNPTERDLMFQRFVQANPRTQVQYGGSGLGLFISKELTERQGGAIGVDSKSGVGSIFAFYIKARCSTSSEPKQEFNVHHRISSHDISAAATSDSRVESRSGTPATPPPPVAKTREPSPKLSLKPSEASRHVLIVEDNLVNQKVLSRQLKNIGCEVYVANHGAEAVTFLENSCFWKDRDDQAMPLSVVLMDLEMPVMTGLECVEKIRNLQSEGTIRGHVPIIAVTANARDEQLLGAKNCGMDAVVTKPFRIPELVPEIERLVNQYTDLNNAAGSWPLTEALKT